MFVCFKVLLVFLERELCQFKSSETKRILFFFLFSFLFGQVPHPKMLRARSDLSYVYRRTRTRELGVAVNVEPTTDEQKTHADDDDGEIIIIFFLRGVFYFFYDTKKNLSPTFVTCCVSPF